MDFPSCIAHASTGGPEQRPVHRVIVGYDYAAVIARMTANAEVRPVIFVPNLLGPTHSIAVSTLARHCQRLRTGAGRALAPHVMGGDNVMQV